MDFSLDSSAVDRALSRAQSPTTAPARTPLRPTRLDASLDTALTGALMAGEIFQPSASDSHSQPAAGAVQLGRGAVNVNVNQGRGAAQTTCQSEEFERRPEGCLGLDSHSHSQLLGLWGATGGGLGGAAGGGLPSASAVVHCRRVSYSTQHRRVEHSRRATASLRTSRPPPAPPPLSPLSPPGQRAALRGSMFDETAALADIFAEMANDTATGVSGAASAPAAPRAAASMDGASRRPRFRQPPVADGTDETA
jgi:hypothetical protein